MSIDIQAEMWNFLNRIISFIRCENYIFNCITTQCFLCSNEERESHQWLILFSNILMIIVSFYVALMICDKAFNNENTVFWFLFGLIEIAIFKTTNKMWERSKPSKSPKFRLEMYVKYFTWAVQIGWHTGRQAYGPIFGGKFNLLMAA